jgi:DNA-binding MarR family transcriptional regulator
MEQFKADEINGNAINISPSELREEIIGEIFDRLYGLSNVTDEHTREIEKLTGLTKNQALTVKEISRTPSARVSDLARSMHLNPATMVRILDRLEEQELITRTRSKVDRRVVEIELTEKATDIRLVLRTITHGSMMNSLGATSDRDLMDMLKALHKLSSFFNATSLHASMPQEVEPLKGES